MTHSSRRLIQPQVVRTIEQWCQNQDNRWLTAPAIDDFLTESIAADLTNLLHLGGWPSTNQIPTAKTLLSWCMQSEGAQLAEKPELITTMSQFDQAVIYLPPSRRAAIHKRLVYAQVAADPYKYSAQGWATRSGLSISTIQKIRRDQPDPQSRHYSPRTADAAQQIMAEPYKHTVQEWAELLGISTTTVSTYRRKAGMEAPVGRPRATRTEDARRAMEADPYQYTAKEWADIYGISVATVANLRRELKS